MSTFRGLLSGRLSEENAVFDKATPIIGWPEFGIDCDGQLIKRSDHGLLTQFGWQIDHAIPKVLGGQDIIANYRPRHWRGNTRAGGLLSSLLRYRRP